MRSVRWWNGGKPYVVTGKVVTHYENGSLLIEDTAGRRFFARAVDVLSSGEADLFSPIG